MRILLLFLLAACGEAPESIGRSEEALFGAVTVDSSCTPAQADLIRQAWARGQQIATSPDYTRRLKWLMQNQYTPCFGSYRDPWWTFDRATQVVKALQAALTPNPGLVKCGDLSQYSAIGVTWQNDGYDHTNAEQMTLDRAFLDSRLAMGITDFTLQSVAEVLWHEAAHTHGYMHNRPPSGTECGYSDTWPRVAVPYHLGYSIIYAANAHGGFASDTFGKRAELLVTGRYQSFLGELQLGDNQLRDIILASGYEASLCDGASRYYGLGSCVWPANERLDSVSYRLDGTGVDKKVSYVEVRPRLMAFTSPGYLGTTQTFAPGVYRADRNGLYLVGNDRIRSLQIPDGIAVRACSDEGTNGFGQCATYDSSVEDTWLGGISYLEVTPRVVAFTQPAFLGARQSFAPGEYQARLGELATVGNDTIRSILVHPDLIVTVCSDEPAVAVGDCQTFDNSTRYVGAVLDRRISYLRVEPRVPASCGNGVRDPGESCENCTADFGMCAPSCGDGMCSSTESCGSCPADCGSCCGNGACDNGEDCNSCSWDCGTCVYCGNDVCDGGETYRTCPGDCTPPEPTCFVAGTSITLFDGTEKPIEEVRAGDLVLAFDETRGALAPGRVVNTFVHPDSDGLVQVNDLTTTREHRFYSDGRWLAAAELRVGSPLFGAADTVHRLQLLPGRATTYNFEVEEFHDYFAGGQLVHNRKAPRF